MQTATHEPPPSPSPSPSAHVYKLQEFFDNTYKPTYSSKELEALPLTLASTENAGATVTTLPTAPFKGADGEVRQRTVLAVARLVHIKAALTCHGPGRQPQLAGP